MISVIPGFRRCFLNEAFAIAQGTVWSFSPETISSGPRSGFLLSTLASVHGFRLAVAAWNSGAPGAGTWKVSWSCFASTSLRALAQPYRNWSKVSATARLRLAGFPSTGIADLNEEIGSGNTPRKGAGSIATDAVDKPRPAMIWLS